MSARVLTTPSLQAASTADVRSGAASAGVTLQLGSGVASVEMESGRQVMREPGIRENADMSETRDAWDPALATRLLRCERCGTTFGCRNTGDDRCWCSGEAFRLPMPLPEGVGPFAECLCPGCLRAVAEELRAKGLGAPG